MIVLSVIMCKLNHNHDTTVHANALGDREKRVGSLEVRCVLPFAIFFSFENVSLLKSLSNVNVMVAVR